MTLGKLPSAGTVGFLWDSCGTVIPHDYSGGKNTALSLQKNCLELSVNGILSAPAIVTLSSRPGQAPMDVWVEFRDRLRV